MDEYEKNPTGEEFMTDQEKDSFRFHNRGKRIDGGFDRIFSHASDPIFKEDQGSIDASIARSAHPCEKKVVRVKQRGIEKKQLNPIMHPMGEEKEE